MLTYLSILDSFGALDKMDAFTRINGRKFYGMPIPDSDVPLLSLLKREPMTVKKEFEYDDDDVLSQTLVPFLAGKSLTYSFNNLE
jgi:dihydroorotase